MTCNTCNDCNPCEKDKKACCELKVLAGDCVDVEEVDWQYVVSATCPPRVRPWDNVSVKIQESGVEWYSKDYTVSAKNDKVWVCTTDTPGYLNEKIRTTSPIEKKMVGCGDWNWYIEIWLDEDALDFPDEKVAVKFWCRAWYLDELVEIDSKLIEKSVEWCKLIISDKATTWYDNNVCLWFQNSKSDKERLDSGWDAIHAHYVDFWWIYTWNKDMATANWIKILKDWYYRVFGQLTVQNNTWWNRYINLARWLLIINRPWESQPILLNTAKHWQYARQIVLRWWEWIEVSDDWEITYVEDSEGRSQEYDVVQWPWMTFNMDWYFDLHEWDIITLWYRPQSNMPEGINQEVNWTYPGSNDITTEYQAIYWWTIIWAQMIVDKWFTDWEPYWIIWS